MSTTLDTPIDAPEESERRTLPAIWFPLAVFAAWRILDGVVAVFVYDGGFIETGLRWDAGNYIDLTRDGYEDPSAFQPVTAFFPFIAWCAQAVRFVIRDELWSYTVVANVAALGAFVGVWAAVREWRSEVVARWAVVLLALFPATYFLWAFYSEAAFIGLSAGAMWAAARDKPWLAGALLAATAATRTIGILVAVVLVVAHLWRVRRVDARAVIYGAGGALGIGLVMLQMWIQVDDPLAFLSVQQDWGASWSRRGRRSRTAGSASRTRRCSPTSP
ncbi:MAG: mannosyltransferase family protein [Acidimicrobiia bacterium]|nr:mannosyltransferase family protein [Acidimicrobiia bacterium]